MLRPEPMGWVDIVLEARTAPAMCEVIASMGLFEPDRPHARGFDAWDAASPAASVARELRAKIRPYQSWLPDPDPESTTPEERSTPFTELAGNLARTVERWVEAAQPELQRMSSLEERHSTLMRLTGVLALMPEDARLELWRSEGAGERAFEPLVLSGSGDDVVEFLESVDGAGLRAHFAKDGDLAAAAGVMPRGEVRDLLRKARLHRLEAVVVPDWMEGSPHEAGKLLRRRLEELAGELSACRERVGAYSEEFRMAGVRWLIERQNWLENVLEHSNQGEKFLHLGGWVPRQGYARLVDGLKASGRPFLIRLDDGESHGVSPSMLNNPPWARRFELFVSGFGTPGVNEVDPSMILAIVTPLMFGYMFGDVGQGLLLVAVGWALRRRLPWISLLVPAGVSSIVFGFLYGSVFSVEHVIPALWLHPMERPLVVLGTPLLLGMFLMLLSLWFGFVEARWRRDSAGWLFHQLPVLLCYLAIPAAFFSLEAMIVLLAGALGVMLFGPDPRRRTLARRILALPGALMELLEHWLQIVINTLSFTRLGAFALAHAGLSTALLSLAELPSSTLGALLVMVVGNVFITALEGLVVSIQTTRLVMFEFFRRFFEGTGRRFQPLTMGGHPGV